MKTFVKLILCMLCSILLPSLVHAATSNGQSLDRIVAIVNDTPITQSELDDTIATVKRQMAAAGTAVPPDSALRKQIIQQLIDRKIQLQLAEQAGIKVDDAKLDGAIRHIAETNKASVAELYEQVKNQGMSVEDYRKELREQIIIQELQQQQVGAKITITPQEVNDFMKSKPWQVSNNKEYHIEDILIAIPESPTTQQIQDAKKRADALLEKIRHGLNFSTAAMSESSDKKALEGGDLGWRKLPEIPSAFAAQVMHMQPNDIAGPIQAPNGFHLIYLKAVRTTGKTDTSTKQVEQLIYQRKMEEAIQTWLAKIRSAAFINMNPEN
jgi:peptidyl-prolyl cis-trans isomerase SurA